MQPTDVGGPGRWLDAAGLVLALAARLVMARSVEARDEPAKAAETEQARPDVGVFQN